MTSSQSNSSCEVCEAVRVNGYNSTKWTHCKTCCAKWTGDGRQHCTVCHETFDSVRGSDRHWTEAFGHLWPGNLESLYEVDGIWYCKPVDFGKNDLMRIRMVKEFPNFVIGEEIVVGKEGDGLDLDLGLLLDQIPETGATLRSAVANDSHQTDGVGI